MIQDLFYVDQYKSDGLRYSDVGVFYDWTEVQDD